VFHEVGKIPACRDLFAEGKTPLWAVGPSGDTAMKLLAFWRDVVPETGELQRSFEVEDGDTRFLGDLYQDLSERARKKYALLQTPVFVEEFILDRTLNPAIDEFGLDEVRMIDPTCGSGHFLLGGFARLFDLWIKRVDNEVVAAQKALDGVWGCDINPFAVAIARFRLIVAALRACGISTLGKQSYGWNIHLATGDSLLFGSRWDREGNKKSEQQFLGTDAESWAPDIYACGDKETISEVLGQQYHVVVGNPPYIIVRDRSLNQAYRDRYSACHQKNSLSVPFAERFVELAIFSRSSCSGFIGQITSNSFMKREFGKKLIEVFFPTIDLTHVIDTSGVNLPGHTTSTVVLFARNRPPSSDSVRAVLGIKGDHEAPVDPSQGRVWRSVVEMLDDVGSENAFISVVDMPRDVFNQHPWSTGGGGAAELKDTIDSACKTTLSDFSSSVGFASFPGQDDAFVMDTPTLRRIKVRDEFIREFAYGEAVRDWQLNAQLSALAPYDDQFQLVPLDMTEGWARHLWSYRTCLENVVSFAGQTRKQLGDNWWGWYRWIPDKYRNHISVMFAEVASHNNFVIDRGQCVFKQTAPVVKFKSDVDENTILGILGTLNSSVVGFWLMQVCQCKGDGERGMEAERWFRSFQFNSTKVNTVPLPHELPITLTRQLEELSIRLKALSPSCSPSHTSELAASQKEAFGNVLGEMIFLQEEIDWYCYRLYGVLDENCCYGGDEVPEVALGQRAFEIVMARQMAKGELETTWFERHGSTPTTEIAASWPKEYRSVVERRIELIETTKEFGLIEKPEYKRRWSFPSWDEQHQRALHQWLLQHLEGEDYWPSAAENEPRLQSVAEIADKASGDQSFLEVGAAFRGREDFDVAALVSELVCSESVPLLSALRYKPSGRRKRTLWENVWDQQRAEDSGKEGGAIKSPPTYSTNDFQRADYYRLRGKLDVPKERWISFPHCETESDPSLVVGCAGWNHLQQATALIAYYDARKREGWDVKRLTPLLAGLDQLLPWIHQWHPDVDPEFGETAGQSYQTMLEADAHELGLTLEEIRAWEPPKKTTTRRKRKTK
ncbi:MAG: BREX-2 system adenine-specific DNA-methyltransferase PglX, partial [Pirellulales bacterium]